ncbi:MAG: HAD-IIA family hydrolase, partial [Solirubrobacterales bacterium]
MPRLQLHDGLLVDLDGVVWLSREPIEGSIDAIERIRAGGRDVVFVTNDPRSTRAELAERLGEVGAPTDAEELFTSASATARAIATEREGASVIAVGASALATELEAEGLEVVAVGEGARADVVAIGGGSEFDYELLRITHEAVREGGELWATNKDPVYPTASGLVPGTGAFVAAVEYAAGLEARS